MLAHYEPMVDKKSKKKKRKEDSEIAIKQANKKLRKLQELKEGFRAWNTKPITEYEIYKKEDQPVIDAIVQVKDELGGIKDDVIKAIGENKELENRLMPYKHEYNKLLPSTPENEFLTGASDDDDLFYDLEKVRTIRKGLENKIEKEKKKLSERQLFPVEDDSNVVNLSSKLTDYINNANDYIFGLRPVGTDRYIGDSKIKFDNDTTFIKVASTMEQMVS